MAVTLTPDARKLALTSLRRYCVDELELEIPEGDLRVHALLDYVLAEIGPTIYNGAVADAQTYLRDRVADLEGTCHEREFGYWPKGSSVRRK